MCSNWSFRKAQAWTGVCFGGEIWGLRLGGWFYISKASLDFYMLLDLELGEGFDIEASVGF